MRNFLLAVVSPALLLFASGTVSAQDADDPPSRVARIAYIAGPVSFEPASIDQWADASVNYPMTTGDSLYSDSGARAVLRIGQNAIRLNSGTNFQFVNLSDNVVQTSINSGSMSLRVRHLFDSESWEVDTPNGAITFLRTGEYRIDTDASRNATMVTVRSGDIEVTANSQSFPVHSGQTAYFDDSGNAPDIEAPGQADDFDSFVVARDRMEDAPPPQYVSPDMVGYEDLNANGEWRNTPDGPVWTPRVAAGWTPYHDGHWVWIGPWGWTWVDDAPWGFAPFHYGRWAYADGGWGWYPGAVAERPYYAPALVAFVGGAGFGVSVSVGGGGGGGLVGWFPLGPKEVYYPSYQVSPTYVRQVNVTNTRITNINVTNVNVTNITYVNRSAVVAVPQNSFVSAQSVNRVAVHMSAAQIQQGQVIGAAPKVAPQPQSVMANSGRKAAAPPAALATRPVVAKLAPPPAAVPFAAQQQMLQQHPGTPVVRAQLQTLRTQNPAPARVQVKPIDTKQVHAITPVVHTAPAPALAQHVVQTPAQPQKAPQAAPVPNPRPASVPAAAAQVAPPARVQPPPTPAAPIAPPVREQVQPAVRPPPAAREPTPPPAAPKAPPVREQAQPVARPAPAPVRPEAQPKRETPPPAQKAVAPAAKPPAPKKEEKKSEDKKE